ncbi:MAG: NAD-dependent epimerase/dehydratase family protein [bacterium]
MTLQGKRVLVTGGTGFIGGRLIEKLILDHQAQVRVLVRNFGHAARIARFPLEMKFGDIQHASVVDEAVQGCDFVLHCAHDPAMKPTPQMKLAVQGTRNVCQAVLAHGVQRLVHVSTFAVYGPMKDRELTETSNWLPTNQPYILAKRAAERYVLDAARNKRLPAVVLQPTIVYGPYCQPWTIRPIMQLKNQRVPLVNGGEGYCNAVYVDDCVEAIIQAAVQPEMAGETFLVSGEQPISWRTFYQAFEKTLHVQATVELSAEQLMKMIKDKKRSQRTIHQLLNLARHPKVINRFCTLPATRNLLQMVKKHVSPQRWQSIEAALYLNKNHRHQLNGKLEKEIYLPEITEIELFRSKTQVKIDKAKNRLGYRPAFNFQRGMELTGRYIQWANLNC